VERRARRAGGSPSGPRLCRAGRASGDLGGKAPDPERGRQDGRYRSRRHLRADAATRRRQASPSALREAGAPRTPHRRPWPTGHEAGARRGQRRLGLCVVEAEPPATARVADDPGPDHIFDPLHRSRTAGSRHRASIERWLDTTEPQTGTTRSSSATCTTTGSARGSVYSVPDRAGSSTSGAAPAHTRRSSATGEDGTSPARYRRTCCAAPATEASPSCKPMPLRFPSRTRASTPRSRLDSHRHHDFAAAVRGHGSQTSDPFVYAGHPCFVGPHALLNARGVPDLHAGYRPAQR
jgi:hypothetical protein